MNFNDPKFQALAQAGKLQAIVKEVAGRRMLIGFERNEGSRKFREKFITSPIDLDALGKPPAEPVDPATLPKRPPEPAALPATAEATPPLEPPVMKNPPPPPNQAVVEMLAMAPNFATLQPMVLALHKNFSHAPKFSQAMWQKTADERVLLFIKEAEDFEQIAGYLNYTLTRHSWPTSEKMKRKFQLAADRRREELQRRIPKSP